MTGLASLLVVAVISGLAAVTFWFPQKEKSQNYYLTKDLINCSVLFVAIPLVVVKNNEKMQKYILNVLRNHRLSHVVTEFVLKWKSKLELKLRNNKVASVNIVNVVNVGT